MKITTRRAFASDARDLLALSAAFDRSQNVSDNIAYVEASLRENPTEEVYVAIVDERLVGFVTLAISRSFAYERPTAEVSAIFVDGPTRRNGIATQLIETVKRRCEELQCLEVYLRVNRRNENARKFYEHCGMTNADHLVYRYRYYDNEIR